jgi:hypothetical protein
MVDSVMKVNQVFFFLERAQGETLSFLGRRESSPVSPSGRQFYGKIWR